MWKILLHVLLQTNNHCREKHGWHISLHKIQAKAMVPKHFLPAYSRMLHLKKKEYVMVIWPTLQINRRETTDNAHSDRCSFKICEKLTHCAGEKDICWKMWLFLKRTHLVHPWKILVHPGVYDTPGWQALLYVTVFGNFHTISKLGW